MRFSKSKKAGGHPGSNVLCNSFFQEIKPLLYIYRIIGRFPYAFSEYGVEPFCPSSFSAIYTYFYYLLTSGYAIYLIQYLVSEKLFKAKNNAEGLFICELIVFQLHHLIDPITYYWGSKNCIRYFHLWATMEKLKEEHTSDHYLNRAIKLYSFIVLPFFTISVFLCSGMHKNISFFTSTASIPVLTARASSCVLWVSTLYKIKQEARRLYFNIRLNGLKVDFERRRQTWLCLSQLTTQVGSIFSFGYMFSFLAEFFSFVASSYGFIYYCCISKEINNMDMYGHLNIAISIILLQYIFSSSAHGTSIVVGEEFCYNILLMDFTKLSNKCMDQVIFFLMNTITNPPVVHLAGYATINKTRVIRFYSNMLTYLVVLVQFEESPHEFKKVSLMNKA